MHQRLTNSDKPLDSEQILASPEFQKYTTQFIVVKDTLYEVIDIAKFWRSFQDMVEILFNILYSTRAGK